MQLANFGRTCVSLAVAGTLSAVPVACSDTPTEVTGPPIAFDHGGQDKDHTPPGQDKAPTVHSATVRSDGMLVGGTAISAERFNTGTYFVRFPTSIQGCGGAANSASFAGFDISVFRISAQLGIGVGEGGGPDEENIIVSLFSTSDGSSEDTSFSLVLVCP